MLRFNAYVLFRFVRIFVSGQVIIVLFGAKPVGFWGKAFKLTKSIYISNLFCKDPGKALPIKPMEII